MWERLGLALLHFVWQGFVVATVVAVVTAYLPRGRQRYAAYLFGMALMLACLPATFVVLRPASIAPLAERGSIVAPRAVATLADQTEDRAVTATWSPGPVGTHWIDPRHLPVAAVWAWLAGASLISVRLPLAWLAIRRFRTSATPAGDELQDRADALSRTLGLRRMVSVMLSTRVVQPLVMGCLPPVILLPVSIATEMPLAMLEAVIAHELAHVRRWDLWVVYAQRLAETVLFYHPAVWWISARISGEREICCDDLAVAATGRRVDYAAALERAARHAFYGADAAPSAALSFGADRHPTLERVRRVLGVSPARPAWGWTSGVGAIVVMAMLFAVGCGLARSRGRAAADQYRLAAPTDPTSDKGARSANAAPTRPAATTRPGARLIFRPTTTNSGKTSWSGPIPDRPAGPGRAFMLVTAHRGDRFPIRVRHDGPPLCQAKIVDGDEHQIELELNDGAAPRRTLVKLNQPERLNVGGHEITVSYGETRGEGDAPLYVDHATLIITFKGNDGDQVELHKTLRLEPAEPEPATQRSSGTSRRTIPMTTTTPTTSSRNP